MEIIRAKKHCEDLSYELEFANKTGDGVMFGFKCDKDGNPVELTEAAKKNYQDCLNHTEQYEGPVKRTYVARYTEPAVGRCERCGAEVELENQYMGACQCPECGQWYNLFGEKLLPPDSWGELREEF